MVKKILAIAISLIVSLSFVICKPTNNVFAYENSNITSGDILS